MNKCPYCGKEIDYSILFGFFSFDFEEFFKMECPHCGKVVQVEAVPVPEFELSKLPSATISDLSRVMM